MQRRCLTRIDWAQLKPSTEKDEDGQPRVNPTRELFEEKCEELWKAQSADDAQAPDAGSQDDASLGRQGPQQLATVAGASPELPTRTTTGPNLGQVGTSVVMGANNDLDRASRNTDTDDGLGGRGPQHILNNKGMACQ